mmetsp:Transcript_61734/g.141315  ORF Transcript_61734/g.141315 Transcript_61734/m.141315 type:complete len:206 (+) Transcript_61734:574-1191(+)
MEGRTKARHRILHSSQGWWEDATMQVGGARLRVSRGSRGPPSPPLASLSRPATGGLRGGEKGRGRKVRPRGPAQPGGRACRGRRRPWERVRWLCRSSRQTEERMSTSGTRASRPQEGLSTKGSSARRGRPSHSGDRGTRFHIRTWVQCMQGETVPPPTPEGRGLRRQLEGSNSTRARTGKSHTGGRRAPRAPLATCRSCTGIPRS